MTQSPNPNSRRRRLTADELIAIMVAMSGIGTIFWWSISHRQPQAMNVVAGDLAANVESGGDNGGIVQTFPLTAATGKAKAQVGSATVPAVSAALPTVVLPSPAIASDGAAGVGTGAAIAGAAVAGGAMTVPQPSAVAASPFADVSSHWSKDYITALQERGVLSDFGDGKFEPNLPVTRGEYAKMLDRAFDRPVSQQVIEFKDIPASYPRKEAVDKAVKMGFMSGYSKTKFSPDEQIPRYQMQISLAKGMGLKIPGNVDGILAKYSDATAMPTYAREKMAAAIDSNFIVKDDAAGLLQPVKATTRGEAAALIYEALVKEGKIPAGK